MCEYKLRMDWKCMHNVSRWFANIFNIFVLRLKVAFDLIEVAVLQEKTRKRLHFHGTDREALISFVGVKNLPIEFGGELEMPNKPIGQDIYEYLHKFEKIFEGNPHLSFILLFCYVIEIKLNIDETHISDSSNKRDSR